jgi:L-seryl-tRNA(Ser) seleniumtransferase
VELTGAAAGLVVNNCAAGLILGLASMARGRDVVVSRSELVEIGGGFRIPEMLRQAGARLREVGATNRTRLADYDAAVRAGGVGAILKVHRSNFRISGFTEETPLQELAALAREGSVPLLYDLGSGLLSDPERLGLPAEPRPQDAIRDGADLVVFSGDKLLGGPQAGLVVGGSDSIDALRRHPLCRAFRVDKATLAALEATLRLHRDPEGAIRRIPVLTRLAATREEIRERCEALTAEIATRCAGRAEVSHGPREGRVGGGTFPGHAVPSWGVAVRPSDRDPDGLAGRLRHGEPAVIGRVEDGAWWMDLRTVDPGEEAVLLDAVAGALGQG